MPETLPFTGGDISAAMAATPATPAAAPATPASAPPPSVTAPPSPASTPPAVTGTTPTSPEPGPIPLDRHKEILENTRRKVAEQYAWLGARTQADIERMEQWYQFADRDPVTFHEQFGEALRRNPMYASRLQPQKPAETPPDPVLEPDLVGPDGSPAFSARAFEAHARALRERMAAEVERRLDERLGPVEQRVAQADLEQHARQVVAGKLNEARTWEGFEELRDSIKRRMGADGRLSLEGAYLRAYEEEFKPKLRDRIRQEVLGELTQKANATTERAAGVAPVTQKADRDKSFAELLRERVK